MEYKNSEMINPIRILIVTMFTALNGFIPIQYIAKVKGDLENNIIDENKAKKKIVLIIIIFIIIAIIECFYMKSIQQGILNMSNKK